MFYVSLSQKIVKSFNVKNLSYCSIEGPHGRAMPVEFLSKYLRKSVSKKFLLKYGRVRIVKGTNSPDTFNANYDLRFH